MKACIAFLWLTIAACDTPDLKLVYRVDPTGGCGEAVATCSDVPMQCESVMSIRVLRPNEPTAPYISVCEEVNLNRDRNLCAIASVNLAATRPLPREQLEIQVAVWPKSAVTIPDPNDPALTVLDCLKIPVEFEAITGFPRKVSPTPAVGGRTWFFPGDEQATVTLGCSDLQTINEASCIGPPALPVVATIDDFDTGRSVEVPPGLAEDLSVTVGEPRGFPMGAETVYELTPNETDPLELVPSTDPPAWAADFEHTFNNTACIEVLEDVAQATRSVACQGATAALQRLEMRGVRLAKGTLSKFLTALGLPMFPIDGMTIGIVRDEIGNPLAGYSVNRTGTATIKYITANGLSVVPNGTMTTASGLWVSLDAPYNTVFSAFDPPANTVTAIGGKIREKVTITVLQFNQVAN